MHFLRFRQLATRRSCVAHGRRSLWTALSLAASLGGLTSACSAEQGLLARSKAAPALFSCCNAGALWCANQAGTCTAADCVLNVRDFGAAGTGAVDDTQAIQCAINAASNTTNYPTGAAVYLPAGEYLIGGPLGQSGLQIAAGGLRFYGDGDSSVLYVTSWAGTVTQGGYLTIGSSSGPVNNVRLEDFRFLGADGGCQSSTFAPAIQIGVAFVTAKDNTVSHTGLRNIHVELGGPAVNFVGGGADAGTQLGVGDYVIGCRFNDVCGTSINEASANFADTVIRDNVFINDGKEPAGGTAPAILVGGMRTLVQNNIFENNTGPALAFQGQNTGQFGWSLASENSAIGSGGIWLNGAVRDAITDNALRNCSGDGISARASGAPTDLVIQNNVVDNFGVASQDAGGIYLGNISGLGVVESNFVHCQVGGGNGYVAGSFLGTASWVDRNVVSGCTSNGSIPFELYSSAGLTGLGTQQWVGTNKDLDTGIDAPPLDNSGAPAIPVLSNGGSVIPNVGGSKTWIVGQSTANTTILALKGGSLGESVTLYFPAGTKTTTVLPDGGIDLVRPFTTPAGQASVLMLEYVAVSSAIQWVEVSRAAEAF